VSTVSYHPPPDSKTWKIVLPHTASADTAAGWLAYNRYGQHVKTFTDFDARDLLRLNKDDIIQMIGLVDGIRLYNDLHMKPVAPRLTLYLAQKGESLFHPILLQDVTVAELVRNIAEILEVPVGLFHKVVVSGPNKISIRLTDEYLRYQSFDSAFHYLLIHEEAEACTIHLEPVPYS
jgi:transcription factor CP2-like protein